MLSKSTIKMITSLQNKKDRDEHQLFFAEGEKIVDEILSGRNISEFRPRIHSIYCTEDYYLDRQKWFLNLDFGPNILTAEELKKISALTTPQKVLAIMEMPDQDYNLEIALFPATDENDLILLLDHIQDPGNIGTIIRIAEWFDIKTICCSMNTADVYNPKVVQSSMGSLFRTDIYYTDLIELLETNNRVDKKEKRLVYGTFPDGIDIYEEKLDSQAFVIIGNESKGISTPLEKFITTKLSIPRFTTQPIDSLNAAIATAIVCSEFRRRW